MFAGNRDPGQNEDPVRFLKTPPPNYLTYSDVFMVPRR